MANVKISALPANSTITGTEELAIVQGGTTKKVTVNSLVAAIPVLSDLPFVAKSGVRVQLIEPAVTFTAVTASSAASGTETLLTSSGAHGLTSAVAVGRDIYISSGTGWTVGFYTITGIAVDTSGVTIQIATPFTGQGSPTIALANTEVVAASIAIPALAPQSVIEIKVTYTSDDLSGASKRVIGRFGGQSIYNVNTTTAPTINLSRRIHNRNSTGSQALSWSGSSNKSYDVSTFTIETTTVDTSVPNVLELSLQPTVANSSMSMQMYLVLIYK